MGDLRSMNIRKFSSCLVLALILVGCSIGPSEQLPTQTPSLEAVTVQPTPPATITNTVRPSPAFTVIPASLTPSAAPFTTTPLPAALSTKIPPAPAPAGWIAFASWGGGGNGIDIIHTSSKGWRRLAQVNFPECPAWSPDGRWIAFLASPEMQNSAPEIYLIRPDGGEVIRLTYTSEFKEGLSWSPDGKSIIYSQTSGPAGYASVTLFMVDIYTRQILQLTNTPGVYEHSPAWSHRGDVIAFVSVREDDRPQYFKLMIMNPDGSNIRQVMDVPNDVVSVEWSPDGTKIAFSAGEDCADLYIINQDGSGLQRLTNDSGVDYSATWSPDGKWLSFVNTPCRNGLPGVGGSQLYLIRTDGAGLRQLTKKPLQYATASTWSPIPGLQVGKTLTITKLGSDVQLRLSPSLTSATLMKLSEGETILVQDGPLEADEYLWWQVQVASNGQAGWVAENPGWYEVAP